MVCGVLPMGLYLIGVVLYEWFSAPIGSSRSSDPDDYKAAAAQGPGDNGGC